MPPLLTTGSLAFVFCLALTPVLRGMLVRRGLAEPRGALAIPRMGGVAVFAAAAASLLILFRLQLSTVLPALAREGALRDLAIPVVLVLLVGVADDLISLSPYWKLAGQLLAAGMVVAAGIRITTLLNHPVSALLGIPLTLAWLVGCTNAFNLIDGLDGLAAGLALFATGTLLAHAVLSGQPGLALLMAALFGALAGFLVFNFHPASIFLGDAGSLAVGFLLGTLALLWADKSTTMVGLMAPFFALLLPIMDTVLAIVRRGVRGQSIFGRDQGHIHHRLLRRGLRQRDAVLMLYGVAGVGAVVSLVLGDMQRHFNGELVILLFLVLMAVGIQQLGYTELTEAGRRFSRETRQQAAAELALRRLQTNAAGAADFAALVEALGEAATLLGFAAVELWVGREPSAHFWRGRWSPSGRAEAERERPENEWFCQVPLGGDPARMSEPAGMRLWGPWERGRALNLNEVAEGLRAAVTPRLAALRAELPAAFAAGR